MSLESAPITSKRRASDRLAFLCPDCGHSLDLDRDACASCSRTIRVDETGVIRLAHEDFYYREMPREILKEILAAGDREAMLACFDAKALERGADYSRYIRRYALDARRGAAVSVLDLGPDSRVLDYGAGWGNLTRVLAGVCAQVVCMDLTYESLRFAQALHVGPNADRVVYVHGGDGPKLPFADASFDALVLNGVLEWLPEGADLDRNPKEVQLRFLREVRRVLAPGGQLLVGIENRYGYRYFMGVPEDHTALRFGALLPRWLSDRYSRRVRGRPYRTYTYGYRASVRLLETAGFSAEIHHPWPNYRKFDLIFSPDSVRHYRPVEIEGAGWKRRAFTLFSSGLARFGLFERLTPAFYLLATRSDRQGRPSSLVQAAMRIAGETGSQQPTIGLSSTQTLHLRGEARFVKLPLSDEAARRLELAETGWREMQASEQAPAWLLDDVRLDRLGRTLVYSEPLCRPLASKDAGEADACIEAFLSDMRGRASTASLDLAARFQPLRAFAVHLGFEPAAFDVCVARLEAREWSVSDRHGDLHRDNVVRAADGRCVLIDWDRFEASGAWRLDGLHHAIRREMQASGHSWSRTIATLSEAIRSGSVKSSKSWNWDLLGLEAAGADGEPLLDLYVLDRLSKDLSSVPHFAYIGHPWRGEAERVLGTLLGTNVGTAALADEAESV